MCLVRRVQETKMRKSLRLDKKQKRETHTSLQWWVQDSYHFKYIEMECGQKYNNVVSCSGAGGCGFEGSGKEYYSDISKICFLRCTKTIDNFKDRFAICQCDCHHDCFGLEIFTFRPTCVVTFGLWVCMDHHAGLT